MPSESPRVSKSKPSYPTARPARPRSEIIAPVIPVVDKEVEAPWMTPEMLKGWASSLIVHAVLLIGLACLYFAPKANLPRAFDTRLAGSERGVEEGFTLTGGLNTELAMPEEPITSIALADPLMAPLKPLDLPTLEPKISTKLSADRSGAEGGIRNDNPGAGDGDGFGLARFGEGGELVRGVEVKVGDPQFTLIWDTNADLDLHVIEPGGKEIYWEKPNGVFGGELDVDNTKGFGPENIYWLQDNPDGGDKIKGMGPPGEYKWFVVYWGGFGGIPKPTHWKVRIKHDGRVTVVDGKFRSLNERSQTRTLTVKPPAGILGSPTTPP